MRRRRDDPGTRFNVNKRSRAFIICWGLGAPGPGDTLSRLGALRCGDRHVKASPDDNLIKNINTSVGSGFWGHREGCLQICLGQKHQGVTEATSPTSSK